MSGLADRRRNNGPAAGSRPLVFLPSKTASQLAPKRPLRIRKPDELRKIYLKTGITPLASGSAYFELEAPQRTKQDLSFIIPSSSAIKLSCTIHGPKPLQRSAAYSPHLALTCYVKFAPFATRHRRGYLRDPAEKDLSSQLEMALRGAIIGERYPKTGVDVCITILEGEEDRWWGNAPAGGSSSVEGLGLMSVLAGCVTVASAALVDAGIDCVDLISGGTAGIVGSVSGETHDEDEDAVDHIVLDPNPTEHKNLAAACVVGYMASRDEMSLLWSQGAMDHETTENLIDAAVSAATGTRSVLEQALQEAAVLKLANDDVS